MNIELKPILSKLRQLTDKLKKYTGITFLVAVLLIYSFLVFRISVLAGTEPDDTIVTEKATSIKRLKVDEKAVSRIEELEDQNIGVQSLFETARDNPFQE